MSVKVPLAELQAALGQRAGPVYLLTVSDDGRPHCVAVATDWQGGELVVHTGGTSARNAAARPQVTLLVPPVLPAPNEGDSDSDSDDHRDYSLIVDGDILTASGPDGGAAPVVRMRPTHAVLHRPASTAGGGRAHDCVPVYDDAPRG